MTAFLAPAQVLGRAYLAPATPPPAAVPEGIVNDRDVLLENAQIKVLNAPGAGVLLIASTPVFRESAAGVVDPEEITFTATLVGLVGTVSFSSTGTTGLATSGKVATLARANMTGTRAAVTAHVTVNGQTFSSNPCMVGVTPDGVDGEPGTPGLTGNTVAQAFLYIWSTVTPENPLGTATFTPAAGKNTAYDISDGWTIDPPPNPNVALAMLWVAVKPVSAPAGTASVSVTYQSGASIIAYSRNGADGLPGIKSEQVRAYRWGNGPAPTIAGTSTYSWPSATYDNVPINWSVTKPASPGPGYTLFEATVNIVETAGAGSSQVDWTTAAIVGISYTGLNGSGSSGDSAMIAYTLVDGVTLNVTPDTITKPAKGRPVSGDWGSTRAWTAQPSQPTLGQAVMQSNGIYNGVLDEVVWGVPYLSNWRVGTLSAITANMGAINAGSLNIGAGNSIIDINGFASFRKLTVYNDAGQVMFSSQNGLTILGAAPGTKNSEIVVGVNLYSRTTFIGTTGDGSTVGGRSTSGFSLHGIGSNNGVLRMYNIIPSNGTFTISFDLAVSFAAGNPLTLDFCDGTTGAQAPWTINPTTTVQSFSHTFEIGNYSAGLFNFIDFNGLSGQDYIFTNFQVEVGANKTAWRLSNQDVAADTAAAATTAQWPNVGGVGKPADNASSDIKLVGRGYIFLAGNKAYKIPGSPTSWDDSDLYSQDSYPGAAFASAVVDKGGLMFGLNTDPTANTSYASIDYAIYPRADGVIGCYEGGVDRLSIGTYAAGDLLGVAYDGSVVRYYRNGVVLRTVTPAAPITAPLFFDSSFAESGASLSNIRFGPLSSNAWSAIGGTGKPADNASSDITLTGQGVTISGNTITKTSGGAAWNADCNSLESFTGGAFASARAGASGVELMFGLNGDPATASNEKYLDFVVYLRSDGAILIFENNAHVATGGTYVGGDQFAVRYDGAKVYYEQNGTVFYSHIVSSNLKLFFDSAFYAGSITNVRFGPLTSVADRLSKTAADILSAPVTLQSNGAIIAGSLTVDANGYRSGGYGVGISQRGMVAYNSAGTMTFQLDFAGGNPYFAGQLSAAYGTFGAVSIAPGGSLGIGATGYNTDPGIWFGVVNGVPKMSICSANGTSLLFNGSSFVVLGDITAKTFSTTGGRFTANTAGEVRADLVDINRRLVLQTGTLDATEIISGTYYSEIDATTYYYQPGSVLTVVISQVVLTDIYDSNVYTTNANQPYYVAAYFDGPTTRNSVGWNGASVQFVLNAKAESIRAYSSTGNSGDNTRVCITFTVTVKIIEGTFTSFRLPLAKWILYKL